MSDQILAMELKNLSNPISLKLFVLILSLSLSCYFWSLFLEPKGHKGAGDMGGQMKREDMGPLSLALLGKEFQLFAADSLNFLSTLKSWSWPFFFHFFSHKKTCSLNRLTFEYIYTCFKLIFVIRIQDLCFEFERDLFIFYIIDIFYSKWKIEGSIHINQILLILAIPQAIILKPNCCASGGKLSELFLEEFCC